ncbi:hypothetical protein VITFI_CDS0330 [Vitreoscilla filiformis]|uniref:Uncharacterized protein n=1 Tax=Vitreoscilla filiformis TaxID=63 RepID=A0A221KAV1_VITFI|nr:hypothetical protein VITFI_CDS0330 [Vitreoscilla filiformis]
MRMRDDRRCDRAGLGGLGFGRGLGGGGFASRRHAGWPDATRRPRKSEEGNRGF